jgi:hypothetical protein
MAAAVAAALILAFAGLWLYRAELLGWAATRMLDRAGLGPARIVVDRVGWSGLHASALSLRGGALTAEAVDLAWAPLPLLGLHLARAEISGLRARLTIADGALELGGRPLAAPSGSAGPAAALHIDDVTIPDARIALDFPGGAYTATVATSFRLAEGGIVAGASTVVATGPLAGAERTLRATAQSLRLTRQAAGGTQLALVKAAVTVDGLPWTAQGIDGALLWKGVGLSAHLAALHLGSTETPPLVAPLAIAGDASLAGPRIEFTVKAEAGAKERAGMTAAGHYDLTAREGAAQLSLGPVRFSAALQPADLVPALAGTVADMRGTAGLAGSLRLAGGRLTPDLTLSLSDLSFVIAGLRLRQMQGRVRLTGLLPPATPAGQQLAATVEVPGLPAAAVTLGFQLEPKPALALSLLRADIAGGRLAASPFVIDPAAPRLATDLTVEHLDLAELVKLLAIDGLSGTGQLSGHIPLSLDAGKVTIAGGRLDALGPGLLRYRPQHLPAALAGAGPQVELALRALSDFRYRSLSLALDKSAGGEGTVLLGIAGDNPAVMNGRAFNFNIRIESNFDRLAGYALLGLSSAEELLRRAKGRLVH